MDSCKNKGFRHQRSLHQPTMPLLYLAFKNALLKPSGEFRAWGHGPPILLARPCNKPFSAPNSNISGCLAHKLAFGNTSTALSSWAALFLSNPCTQHCICAAQSLFRRGEKGGRGKEEWGRKKGRKKEGRRRERGGLENSLEEGARHQEAKVMVSRLVFGVKNYLWGNYSRRISEEENHLRAPTLNDSSSP